MATTIPFTLRDVKNIVLNALPDNEKRDAIVGEVAATGGYVIVTEYRVIELYSAVGEIYVQERDFARTGWETVEVNLSKYFLESD